MTLNQRLCVYYRGKYIRYIGNPAKAAFFKEKWHKYQIRWVIGE